MIKSTENRVTTVSPYCPRSKYYGRVGPQSPDRGLARCTRLGYEKRKETSSQPLSSICGYFIHNTLTKDLYLFFHTDVHDLRRPFPSHFLPLTIRQVARAGTIRRTVTNSDRDVIRRCELCSYEANQDVEGEIKHKEPGMHVVVILAGHGTLAQYVLRSVGQVPPTTRRGYKVRSMYVRCSAYRIGSYLSPS